MLVSYHFAHNSVVPSPACTIQGILINTGDLSSAIWSFIIAVHTFLVLTGGNNWGEWATRKSLMGKSRWIICAGVWGCVVFLGVIGIIAIDKIQPENGPFCTDPPFSKVPGMFVVILRAIVVDGVCGGCIFAVSLRELIVDNSTEGAWCWIGRNYRWERFFFHYRTPLLQSPLLPVPHSISSPLSYFTHISVSSPRRFWWLILF